MNAERFTLDTNILVDAIDTRDRARAGAAAEIVAQSARSDCPLALQAIGEFHAAATRKLKLPAADARARARALLAVFETFAHSATALRTALDEAAEERFSFWDAVLLASAAEAGCTAVLSSDMHDGARLGTIRVIHPFAGRSLSPAARKLLG